LNKIGDNVRIDSSIIGLGTYIGQNSKLSSTQIGSFCSIAHNVEVLPFTHPSSKFVSTHPSFFSTQKQAGFTFSNSEIFDETLFFNKEKQIVLNIGSDVWIGANVMILGGLTIGNGVIIAAGSVVTKSVEPFQIVGGVPARVIRSRFEKDEIDFLNNYQWWNKDYSWILEHHLSFIDIKSFHKKFEDFG
jgi:acetyltransferase-like isoleucine patch superfamily enzyme